jgi:hypothetical protein
MLAIVHTVGVLSFGRFLWKTPLGDMFGDCWIGWYSVIRTHVFSNYLVLEEAWPSIVVYYHHGTHIKVHCKDRCGE